MYKINRKLRKSVSPIIATVLIIALTVAAAATVWIVVNNLLSVDEKLDAKLSLEGFYDFDGNGRADLAVYEIVATGQGSLSLSTATITLTNSTLSDTAWQVMNNSASTVVALQPAYLFIRSTTPSAEFVKDVSVSLKIDIAGATISLTSAIATIEEGPALVFDVSSEAAGLNSEAAIRLAHQQRYDELRLLAETTLVANLKVVIFNARSGFPAGTANYTDDNGHVSFRLMPGYYYARVYYANTFKTSESFYHPASILDFAKAHAISLPNVYRTVSVHYSENSLPTADATVKVHQKAVVSGQVYESVVDQQAVTDVNGTVDFVLPSAEYKFLAYKDTPNPAASSWVDVDSQSDVYINTEPGVIYVRVSNGAGAPVANAPVSAYAVVGSASSYVDREVTNSTGYVKFTISATDFKFKVQYGQTYSSNIYKVVPDSVIEYILSGNSLLMNVTSSTGVAVSNTYIYLYDEYGRNLGYGLTNSSGYLPFYGLSDGSYYLKYYAGSTTHTTNVFTLTGDLTYHLQISGTVFYANVTKDGTPRVKQYVYFMSATNQYLGWSQTNSSGIAVFIAGTNQSSYLRVSLYSPTLGTQIYRSDLFYPSEGAVIQLQLTGESVEVHVEDQSGTSLTYKYVNAYNQAGEVIYQGRTNADGNVTMILPTNTIVTVGMDYGVIIQSSPFNTSITHSINLVITTANFNINVKDASGNDLSGARVYLYVASTQWTYLGYGTTDSNGLAAFSAPAGGNYRVYVYNSNPYFYFYSGNFTISDGATVVIQPSSFTINVKAPDGTPLVSEYVYLYTPQGSYAGYGRTDANGNASMTITNNSQYYVYLYRFGYSSDLFTATAGGLKNITIVGDKIQLQVVDGSGANYIPSTTWQAAYVYYANGTYVGYQYLNTTGAASYWLQNGEDYYFRVWMNGRELFTSTFTVAGAATKTLQIVGEQLTVHVAIDGSSVQNAYLYLYDATTDRYLAYGHTDTNGNVTYNSVLNGTYYVRIYSNSIRQISTVFTVNGTSSFVFSIATTTLTVNLYQHNANTKEQGARVYLRTFEGYYSGYATTNSSGQATFSVAVNGTYYYYAYYSALSQYVYSDVFTLTTPSTIDLRPVAITVHIADSANRDVQGMRAILLNSGVESGYAVSDANGNATVYGNNGTSYYASATKYSTRYGYAYTTPSALLAVDGVSTTINIGGGNVYMHVTDGNGNPVPSTYVYLYKPIGNSYEWTGYYVTTNSTGYANFIGVGEGTYVAYSYGVYSNNFLVYQATTSVDLNV